MILFALRRAACLFALITFVAPSAADAQAWNSERALELVRRATARRSGQIADTSVAAYSAKATGYLTFLGQLGDVSIIPPTVVKQDQIAVEVYWRAPSESRQHVVGRRDTLLLPGDIGYYTDRFGIVQSNFPDRIRMGDGQDVSDVLHPLAPSGLGAYDYAITDSLSIQTGATRIDVFAVQFRPRDPRQPRAIGTAYLDVRNADVVGLQLTFTRAAILDKRIEQLSVVLENALIEGRAWLPRRQSIEVVRTDTRLNVDVRGIIRGRWDVCCYDITFKPADTLFLAPPITFAPLSQLRSYKFEGGILDALPPGAVTARAEDIALVQARAEELVAEAFRERAQRAALSLPRVSDIVRFTRAEGLAVGAAGRVPIGFRGAVDGRVRYGMDDREWKGELGVALRGRAGRSLRAYAAREYADLRDVAEVSGVRNSVAAQEFGSDYTDPFELRAYGLRATFGGWGGRRWSLDMARERHRTLALAATPENGSFAPLPSVYPVDGLRVSFRAEGGAYASLGGTLRVRGEVRYTDLQMDLPPIGSSPITVASDTRQSMTSRTARLAVDAEYDRPLGGGRLHARTIAGVAGGGALFPQSYVYLGGPTTAPGYAFDAFAARRAIAQRVEWSHAIPFVPIPLGRYGRVPPRATLAPFVHAVWVDDPAENPAIMTPPEPTPASPVRGTRQGWYPAVGVALEAMMGVLRIDVARGLRDGRWTFSLDLARMFWPIL